MESYYITCIVTLFLSVFATPRPVVTIAVLVDPHFNCCSIASKSVLAIKLDEIFKYCNHQG